MVTKLGQGNFINGSFLNDGTISLTSKNPSCNYDPVFTVMTSPHHGEIAIAKAREAYHSWNKRSEAERIVALLSFKDALQKNENLMAEAISQEMGKIMSEARTEAKSLSARIDLMISHGLKRVATENFYDLRAETRYHNQGVMLVIGPYNFPAHLVNAHVIPSILLGNTVIIKPSEICPWVAEIYAQCVQQSSLPPGVINIVHGDGAIGRALSTHMGIDGVLFTGSYRTGRALTEALLDQPHKILALEMGGKNFSVVMDDADQKQALLEIIQAAFLTTGQRCTATSRVLVHENIFDQFRAMLITAVSALQPGPAHDENAIFGPMATKGALDHFLLGLAKAKEEGAEVLVESRVLEGGAFVTPSLYHVKNTHPLNYYLGEEHFGPNLCVESFSNVDEAIARINQSPYGLSNAIFSLDTDLHRRMILETKSGVLNINRSTNNAFGQMPFGGVNKSGNQRPAGIEAVRYCSFPMAITSLAYGASMAPKAFESTISDVEFPQTALPIIILRHDIEAVFEIYGIYSEAAAHNRLSYRLASFDNVQPTFFTELANIGGDAIDLGHDRFMIRLDLIENAENFITNLHDLCRVHTQRSGLSLKKPIALSMNVPPDLALPRSRSMLDRLYRGHFVPMEKKTLVADLKRSRGAYFASIDDDPLVIFDAASQIATVGAGFLADTMQNAYDHHQFDQALVTACDLSLENNDRHDTAFVDAERARAELEDYLTKHSDHRFISFAYGASGAEANEIAFDQARLYGPGGTRILAFEGSFHGRTIMALQATYNKEKRGPFAFAGYEASFLPFPELKDPRIDPSLPSNFLVQLSKGEIPDAPSDDPLLCAELASLRALKEENSRGSVCAVIIEPMQCEGGDRYASRRFFCGLRALTRALKLPLIFDEVQTGFHLGRSFFWYRQFNLVDQHGQPELPDCVTMAKKAQLGICMSIWQHPRRYAPHAIQLKRGLLQAQAMQTHVIISLEQKAMVELERLQRYFPSLVSNIRATGLAFAFDMPNKVLANELVEQRFHRGFMVYIAGEKTLRFRLNMACNENDLHRLFEQIMFAIVDMRDSQKTTITKLPHHLSPNTAVITDVTITDVTIDNFARYRDEIAAIEEKTYEPGRQDTMDTLYNWLTEKDSVGLLVEGMIDGKKKICGYAFGGPLEHAYVDGATQDPNRGALNSFYSANLTLADHARGLGLGALLKHEQINRAMSIKRTDGTPRYQFMTGRHRLGHTPAMSQIKENLGAYDVSIHDHQYGEPGGCAVYYRLPLHIDRHEIKADAPKMLHCQNSLTNVFNSPPPSLLHAIAGQQFRRVACSKITLSNWTTPQVVRYSELLRAVMPKPMTHAYFTSGRDEIVDKGLRCLRFHRLQADVAISFSHQWLGHNSAAARSLSHDENQAQPFGFFNWPKVAHPSVVGDKESLHEFTKLVHSMASEHILGVVMELIGERSGFSFSAEFLAQIEAICRRADIPLVFVENASSYYRTGRSLFLTDSLAVKPNMVWWYTGGQLGHVFVDDRYFTDKPLTLISTWDGDEISMIKAYHQLIASQDPGVKNRAFMFEQAMSSHIKQSRSGLGLWQAIHMQDQKQLSTTINKGRDAGILFGLGFNNSLMVCPNNDTSEDHLLHIVDILK